MNRVNLAAATGLLSLGALALACGKHGDTTDPCMPIINGLVAYQPGIDLVVRDAAGRGMAYGDTVIAYSASDSMIATGFDTLHVLAGFARPGVFWVRVKRNFYQEAIIPRVVVNSGTCGGPLSTVVPVTLALQPGAPALRSITVFGADFLYAVGVQSQFVARFDADPSIPTTVTWRLADTTVAHIDPTGVVTAKCTTLPLVHDTVIAIATADTMVKGSALFGIASQTSCP